MTDKGKARENRGRIATGSEPSHSSSYSQQGRPPLFVHTQSGNSHLSLDSDIADLLEDEGEEDYVPPYYAQSQSDSEMTRIEEDVKKMFPSSPTSPVDTNGRVEISLKLKKTPSTSKPPLPSRHHQRHEVYETGIDKASKSCPKLNIVIFIVGSRGDVQPYIALALGLIRTHGHRVRLATHGEFSKFVLDANQLLRGEKDSDDEDLEGRLEYFDAGGDPRELMAYMVKRLMPGVGSIINGDITAKKKMTATYIKGFYNSTFFPDRKNGPFAADAIISNPPAFAHVHVAEALGIPLHMSFTMPWSPTLAFSHPLVTVKDSNGEPGMANYVSYHMAEVLMWQGLGKLINKFRTSFLGLDSLLMKVAPQASNRSNIPWTYCWSQALIPKPKDWRSNIDISGFYFLEGKTGYTPDVELVKFLESGPAPMYIGFGSVPVKDPAAMTKTIFGAVEKAGVRALVSAGWGGLGGIDCPPNIFILQGNIPHDWLFADGRVSAVCHHGGAGTTAIGLSNGLPTIVVPFFGDQQFWGDMIRNAGAGPTPISPKHLDIDTLAEAIEFAYSEEAQAAAQKMGETIRSEDGVKSGVESFHKHLPLLHMRCDVDPNRVALWWHSKLCLRLSGAAAVVLHEAGLLEMEDLKLNRSKEYDFEKHEGEVGQGVISGVVSVVTTTFSGFAELFYSPADGLLDLTWGLGAGLFGIIHDIYQGFDNIPGKMGSDVRARGQIRGWKSGLKEAGLGLGYGIWDGITGMVTEPIVAVKEEGAIGLLTGTGRGLVNAVVRPTAGMIGFMTIPAVGAAKSVRKSLRRKPEVVYRQPRHEMSYREAAKLRPEQKKWIMDRFEILLLETKKRKREFNNPRHRVFLTGEMLSRNNTPPTSRPSSPEGKMISVENLSLKEEGKDVPPPVPPKD